MYELRSLTEMPLYRKPWYTKSLEAGQAVDIFWNKVKDC